MDAMRVKVSTVAFSKNAFLVDALQKEFPNAVVNSDGIRFNESQLVNYFRDADAAIVGLEPITPQLLDQLPSLRMIAKFGVGLDNIDLAACAQRNVRVGWTGGVNKQSVAEMTLGFMLMLCRNLYTTSNELKKLTWNKNGGVSLSGKTIGIIGFGHIGQQLVQLLAPFNCTILVNDIADISNDVKDKSIQIVSKEALYAASDIITIHTPLTNETRNLFNKEVFNQMKSSAFVINTARGGIIDEKDLADALQKNIIAGAALDVFATEPPSDEALLSLPNLICTPHIGGNAYEAVVAMGVSAIEHLVSFRNSQ